MRDNAPIGGATPSFSSILSAAQESQSWAFEYLFTIYSGRLAAYAMARGSANPEAIANAALYEAFHAIGATTDDEPAFACQLFRHTRQKLIEEDERRSVKNDTIDLRSTESPRMRQVLDSLDSEHRDVVLLRVLGDFSAAQTGVIINRPIHAVKVLQLDALREISDFLAESTA